MKTRKRIGEQKAPICRCLMLVYFVASPQILAEAALQRHHTFGNLPPPGNPHVEESIIHVTNLTPHGRTMCDYIALFLLGDGRAMRRVETSSVGTCVDACGTVQSTCKLSDKAELDRSEKSLSDVSPQRKLPTVHLPIAETPPEKPPFPEDWVAPDEHDHMPMTFHVVSMMGLIFMSLTKAIIRCNPRG